MRLRAPLTHELAETMPRWARSLAPVAEKVAHMLGHAMEGKYTPVTPLTSAKLRSAQAVVKARKTEAVGRATRDAAKQRPRRPCGAPVVLLPRVRRPGHQPSPRAVRDLPGRCRPHCRGAPEQRPSHRRPQTSAQRAGGGLRGGRRPGHLPRAHLAQAGCA